MSSLNHVWHQLDEHALAIIVQSGWMSSVLLAAAFVCSFMMRRHNASAATRSLIWTTTFACIPLLPLFIWQAPTWGDPKVNQSQKMPLVSPFVNASASTLPATGDLTSLAVKLVQEPSTPPSLARRSDPAPLVASRNLPAMKTPLNSAVPWGTLAVGIWLVGFLGCLFATAAGWISLVVLRLTTQDASRHPLFVDLQRVRRSLGIQRRVRLVVSDRRAVPMTWGIHHPTILLPKQANHWNRQQIDSVLLHELAHIQRFDYPAQLLARLACSMHWYNPLSWMALANLRWEQEASCDDLVINQGTQPTDYATQLARVVVGETRFRWSMLTTLAAGRLGQLERRVQAILNVGNNRKSPSAYQSVAVSLGVACAAVALVTAGPLRMANAQVTDVNNVEKPSSANQVEKDVLADVRETLANRHVKEQDPNMLTRRAIEGMLDALNDPYAEYLPATLMKEWNIQLQGKLMGIGARLEIKDEYPVVVAPLPNSPALESGVKAGDVILEIDGQSTQAIELRDVVDQIRGRQGSQVQIKVRRQNDGAEKVLVITRRQIKMPSVRGIDAILQPKEGQNPHWIDASNGIAYVHVSSMLDSTPQDLARAIEPLQEQGLKGILLDLRFCPGGNLESAIQIADLFLGDGRVVTIRERDGKSTSKRATEDAGDLEVPLIVLVNEVTASSAEVVAAALQDHDRAKILGTRTFGKASVQSLVRLSDDLGAIKLTIAYYDTPKGRNLGRRDGEDEWGVDADPGFFVPLSQSQFQALQKKLGQPRVPVPVQTEAPALSPAEIRQDLGDPQLAAALQSMRTKVKTGEYESVGGSRQDLAAHLRQLDIQRRQTKLLQTLEELDEIASNLGDEG